MARAHFGPVPRDVRHATRLGFGTLLALAVALVVASCANGARQTFRGAPPLAVQDQWARDRIEAVLDLYPYTPQGREAVLKTRVLHMLGRPGWFGSSGYGGYVGIGDARPASIGHELSHSFWGAFPVEGLSGHSWTAQPGQGVSPGIAALRKDLETFLAQPPDTFEPLRARLRHIPDLVDGAYPGLYHLGEAEIVHFTGGDLDLVPPILRKYYAAWLQPGPWATWDDAAAWWLSLPPAERRLAATYNGIGEMVLDGYDVKVEPDARLDSRVRGLLVREERQRLVDFRQNYDLYFKAIDGPPAVNDFQFWRGYLREMQGLARRYPDILQAQEPRTTRIRQGLAFLTEVGTRPLQDQAALVMERMAQDRSLAPFVIGLEHRALAEMVTADGTPLERSLASAVRQRLQPEHVRYLTAARDILAQQNTDPIGAQSAFGDLVRSLTNEQAGRTNFIIDVFAGVDYEGARALLADMSPDIALRLVRRGPAFVRFLTTPEEWVQVLGYSGTLDKARLVELARLTEDHVAGTFSIDRPFSDAVYRRVINLGRQSPTQALEVFLESGIEVEPFIEDFPTEAAALMDADPSTAARVFREANPVRLTPARAVYLLAQADPAVAARIALLYEDTGDRSTVIDSLLFMAFDAHRPRTQPKAGVSIEKDARLLLELARQRSGGWLAARLREARDRAVAQVASREADPMLLQAWRETLQACLASLGPSDREFIQDAVRLALS